MPHAGASDGVELLELRVLDGPNRFFTRPAVKLEFGATDAGVAADTARKAGEIARRLHLALDLPSPRLTLRGSLDGRRAAVAYPWRRRAIAQSIGARSEERRVGKGWRA